MRGALGLFFPERERSMRENYSFSQVPIADIPRSAFNRSHTHKTTFDSGFLVPVFVDEALPGDTFSVNARCFARLATPLVPFMDNLHLDVFFFAVPNRLVWDNWQKFMGEQRNPGDSTDFLVPQVDGGATGFAAGDMFDYFGVPVGVPNLQVAALHARAYNLIWNEWFRDENLQNSLTVNTDDGPDPATDYSLVRRGKRHDYFMSCLPWPQKGPGVMLPLGTTAPVIPDPATNGQPTFNSVNGVQGATLYNQGTQQGYVHLGGGTANNGPDGLMEWSDPKLVADLSTATAATINSLRQAFQVQKLLERDARGGTRYTEILRSHFGVVSPDARLQRPEYLGGGSLPIVINPVTQTSGTATDPDAGYTPTPQGNLAAYGVGFGKNIGFTKSFVEHSVIIGLICARGELSYQQGLHKMWTRRSRYDFYWPAFSHLGEQAVLNREIYCQGPGAVNPATSVPYDEEVFGYQERWAEYRYFPSKITGKFRSTTVPAPLDMWHLAQKFETMPVLGATFMEERPPVDRVVAVMDEPEFLFDSHFGIRCVRPMPTYSVPGLIDHF